MKKKTALYLAAGFLPATILLFSIVFASSSIVPEDKDIGTLADECEEACMSHMLTSLSDGERREFLGLYLKNQLRIAGCTQLLPFYLPESRTIRRTRTQKVIRTHKRIRPASAHAKWRRQHVKDVFRWPVDPSLFWISSYFGPRVLKGRKGFHQGIDMAAAHGTPVVAAADGYVKEAHYAPGYGNHILLVHPHSYKTRYAHLSKIRVKKGQRVRAGQLIGNVGATGKVTKSTWGTSASHLHFEVYSQGKRVNPFKFLA